MQVIIEQYQALIRAAADNKTPLQIRGGGTKHFYGNAPAEQPAAFLDTTAYHGIVDYEPTELVMTARAGTRLADVEVLLTEHGQMLAFEPPHFGMAATLGGCIAAGLSGPRRAVAGAVRDFVLGLRLLDGTGKDLRFGGQVMKNVAGYDVSRLMAGALGTLGVILEVSLKVLPKPPAETTLQFSMNEAVAIERMNQWAGKPLPVSATCYVDGELFVRLSGAESTVRTAQIKLGGEVLPESEAFWQSIREQSYGFFQPGQPLWRLSVRSTAAPLVLPGKQLFEWNGGLRWLSGDDGLDAETIRQLAKDVGGHATLFRNHGSPLPVFHPLDSALMTIHRSLKQQFDPSGIFNRGRLYPDL
ncbi:glycolate oxidase subunit GlcE [Nitrosomonas sp.]|uniref:glycolate oxidase subunit GlcE n=1 Tax=Nitrosomonas sp. TaxID=42353 RepID=UPI001D27B9DB|nr:glycolate oxidase subunit GlcE [Nitrosomonas sp.]MBX3617402.1 glycolate oxidase subunit GlcE [Nitrosomonas sp.]